MIKLDLDDEKMASRMNQVTLSYRASPPMEPDSMPYYEEDGPFMIARNNHKSGLPDIKCKCGSDSFTLRYGVYSLSARCSKCGKESEVYSG